MCEKQHEQKVRDTFSSKPFSFSCFDWLKTLRSGRIASNPKLFWSHDFTKHSPSVGQENVPGRIQLISSSRFQTSILKSVCGLSGVSQMVTNGFKGEKRRRISISACTHYRLFIKLLFIRPDTTKPETLRGCSCYERRTLDELATGSRRLC